MTIARYIDHTLLKPDATETQIRQLCAEAQKFGFASVCVNPYWVRACKIFLTGSSIKVCSVVGFPFGATMTKTKVDEANLVMFHGAKEIDMVMNIGALKTRDLDLVRTDIEAVRSVTPSTTLKVIIETCLLTAQEKVLACEMAQQAGADFVKTSTGFSTGGATFEDVALMRRVVGKSMGVKASGGVTTLAIAKAMISAGADRLGCSNSVAIIREEQALLNQ